MSLKLKDVKQLKLKMFQSTKKSIQNLGFGKKLMIKKMKFLKLIKRLRNTELRLKTKSITKNALKILKRKRLKKCETLMKKLRKKGADFSQFFFLFGNT